MSSNNSFVASYATLHLARDTLQHLQDAGFDMRKLFVVIHGNAGPSDVEGARRLSQLSELGVSLYNCIPEHDSADFEAELLAGRVILVAHGTPVEIEHAKQISDSLNQPNWDGGADSAIYYGCND